MFSSNYSKVRSEITDDQLRLAAPSIYAGQAMQGVSSRYTFLPTAQVISSMREAGWAPVHAEQQRVRIEGRMGFQKHIVRFQRQGHPNPHAAEPVQGQSLAGLAVGAGVFIDPTLVMEGIK